MIFIIGGSFLKGVDVPLVSIIIVTWNSASTIRQLFETFHNRNDYEVIVVDNDSSDNTVSLVQEFPFINLVKSDVNIGFGRACNLGVLNSKSNCLLFLNPDCSITQNAIDLFTSGLALDDSVGAYLPSLSESIDVVRNTVCFFPSIWMEIAQAFGLWNIYKRIVVRKGFKGGIPWGFAAALAMRRTTFNSIGGFDEDIFLYGEDMDICRRVWNTGEKVLLDTNIVVNHIGSVSSSQAYKKDERMRLVVNADYYYLSKYYSTKRAEQILKLRSILIGLRAKFGSNKLEANLMRKVLDQKPWKVNV